MAITVPTSLPDLARRRATVVDQKRNRFGKMATRKSRFGAKPIENAVIEIRPRPTHLLIPARIRAAAIPNARIVPPRTAMTRAAFHITILAPTMIGVTTTGRVSIAASTVSAIGKKSF